MANDTRVTLDVASDRGGPPPEATPDVSVLELFKRIYQFFYSKTVGLVIIIAMAVLVLFGVVVAQAPAGTYDDATSKAQYLDSMREKFGGFVPIMDFLGLFRVFTSPIFLFVSAMLALSILACTLHRIPQLWQRYRHPRTHVTDAFFDRARYRGSVELSGAGSGTMARVDEALKAKHWRVIVDEKDPENSRYADKFGWGPFGTVAAHASFIIIMASFLFSSTGGIDETLSVPVGGDSVEVGHGTGLTVTATSFKDTYTEDGRPLDYVAHLQVRKGETIVGEQDVRVNEPLHVDNVAFHQASFGMAVDLLVTDAAGETVYKGSVPQRWTSDDGTASIGSIELPSKGYQLQIFTPASGKTGSSLAPGEAAFQLFKSGKQDVLGMATGVQGQPAEVGDLKVTFERERSYTGILVRQDPGAVLMWIGLSLLVIGMTITFICRHRRVWLRLVEGEPAQLRFASADKEDLGFEKLFSELVLDVSAQLDKPTTTKEARRD